MDRAKLALQLATTDNGTLSALLEQYSNLLDVSLAYALKTLYLDSRLSDLARAMGAATALTALANRVGMDEIRALAAWTAGMAALHLEGQAKRAIGELDEAIARFTQLDQPLMVAAIQNSRLHALALLGRYE
jgi:hypothetical protein